MRTNEPVTNADTRAMIAQQVENERVKAKMRAKLDTWFDAVYAKGIPEDFGVSIEFDVRRAGYADTKEEEVVFDVAVETNYVEVL